MILRMVCVSMLGAALLTSAGCASAGARGADPGAAFTAMVAACPDQGAAAIEERLTAESQRVLDEYLELAVALGATNLPANPTAVLAAQLSATEPVVVGQEPAGRDTVWVDVRYRSGTPARFRFIEEAGHWRFDLAREMDAAVEQMREASDMLRVYGDARRSGRPVHRVAADDDDDD